MAKKRCQQAACDPLGTIKVRRIRKRSTEKPGPVARYKWRPLVATGIHLPQKLSPVLNCYTARDRVRRFTPAIPLGSFVLFASVAGHEILINSGQLNGERQFDYHVMRLIYQWAPRLREHFARTFVRAEDFKAPGRGHSVLPDHLGKGSDGRGAAWTVSRLHKEGRHAAMASGYTDPDPATCWHFGFLEAARRNPLDPGSLTTDEALQLVRLALFDLGPMSGKTIPATIELVRSRIIEAIAKHDEADTDEFHQWFFEKLDNVVHGIAKKKAGGKIAREVVRQCILDLVFQSFSRIGDCVHLLMEDFRRALPRKLNAREGALFDLLYQKQKCFGNIPLILLQDRFPFLREAILELLDSPTDPGKIGTLLRLLEFYGTMVSHKRQLDRDYKQRASHRNKSGSLATEKSLADWDVSLASDATSPSAEDAEPTRTSQSGRLIEQSEQENLFQEIAEAIRKKKKAQCKCKTTEHWHAILRRQTDKVVVLADGCEVCTYSREFRMPRAEYEETAKKVSIERSA